MLRWVDTYYFVSVSSSFVGYGDISFRSSLGKGFAIVWLSLCGVILGRAFTYIRMYLLRESVSPETRKNMETKWSPRFENRRIAVALSFIESQATLSWIIDNLPISSGDTIYLIHVASEDSYDNLYRDTGSGDVPLAEFRTTKGRLKYHVTADIESADLQRFGETMKPKKVSVKVRIFYGNPKKKLCEAIKVLQLTSLILGRKETHIIRRMLLSRTSDFIVANASIPVTIVSQKSLTSE
ncbi:hypothetical protein ACLB2K_001758 [Fragaria x ananassa]